VWTTNLLDVENLQVKVGDKIILAGISFSLKIGKSYILFGPNGSGKTTLVNAIMGMPNYEMSGRILFMGEDITGKSVDERAKLGISVGFQNPAEVTGVKLSDLFKLCRGKSSEYEFSGEEKELIEAFKLTEFLGRDVNVSFSGGEKKRSEILQMIFLKPRLLLLDEPDSGVDVESLKLIGGEIQRYVKDSGSTAFIITHQGGILEYMDVKHACVLLNSRIHCYKTPKLIYETLKSKGYEECVRCQERVTEEW